MAYTPINIPIFIAAFSGALAGMGSSDRVPTNNDANSYADLAREAGAFAEAYDEAWDDATPANSFEVESTQTLCESTWQSRTPLHLAQYQDADSYHALANALVAMVHAGSVYFAANAITPPPAGGTTFGGDLVEESPGVQRIRGVKPFPTRAASGEGVDFIFETEGAAEGSVATGGDVVFRAGPSDGLEPSPGVTLVPRAYRFEFAREGGGVFGVASIGWNMGGAATIGLGQGTDGLGTGVAGCAVGSPKSINIASHQVVSFSSIQGPDISELIAQNVSDEFTSYNSAALQHTYTTRATSGDDVGMRVKKTLAGNSPGTSSYYEALHGDVKRFGVVERLDDVTGVMLYGVGAFDKAPGDTSGYQFLGTDGAPIFEVLRDANQTVVRGNAGVAGNDGTRDEILPTTNTLEDTGEGAQILVAHITLTDDAASLLEVDILARDLVTRSDFAAWKVAGSYSRLAGVVTAMTGPDAEGADAGHAVAAVPFLAPKLIVNGTGLDVMVSTWTAIETHWTVKAKHTINASLASIAGIIPSDIPGLVGWWRSDLDVTSGGGTVSAWGDQAGGPIASLTPLGSEPGYFASGGVNDRPYLLGSGTNGMGDLAALLSSASDRTVFIVSQQTSIGINGVLAMFCTSSPSFGCTQLNIGGTLYVYTTGTANDTTAVFDDVTEPNFMCWQGEVGQLPVVRMNGVPLTIDGGVNVVDATGTNGFSLMCRGDAGQGIIGKYYECFVYDRLLDAGEIEQAEDYIRAFYAL